MTFELARVYDEVVGIDYSKSFIDTCCVLRDKGRLRYNVLRQGEITSELVAIVDSAIVIQYTFNICCKFYPEKLTGR